MISFLCLCRLCYAHTQGSLRLLESVCRCAQLNEPILLVGETGVGKTATVNYLAGITGKYVEPVLLTLVLYCVHVHFSLFTEEMFIEWVQNLH